MTALVDLHTHTNASDGTLAPAELVRLAKSKGLAALAITDHDTTDGLEEAVKEAERLKIGLVPGVEIGVDFKHEMHMLGYFLKGDYRRLHNTLDQLKKNREERNPKIIAKLNELGFDISLEEVLKAAGGSVVGRPHIAGVLLRKGYVKSVKDAFEKYLSDGRPAYVKKDKLNPVQAIKAIREAGGLPVIAHPVHLGLEWIELDNLFGELKKHGLIGIEAYYVDNTDDETGHFLNLAVKHGLVATGGSDFHGEVKPDIELGVGRGNLKVPYECLEQLKKSN